MSEYKWHDYGLLNPSDIPFYFYLSWAFRLCISWELPGNDYSKDTPLHDVKESYHNMMYWVSHDPTKHNITMNVMPKELYGGNK